MRFFLKSIAYRFLHSRLSKPFFKLLPVSIRNFDLGDSKSDKFYFLITVDVEPGFAEPSGRQVWINQDNRAFVGVGAGLKNIQEVLQRYQVPATFFVTPQCFSESEYLKGTLETLRQLDKSGSEIGLHLHPREDEVLKARTGKSYKKTSSHYYDQSQIEEMLTASREIFRKYLGDDIAAKLTSFRWGNWGLSTQSVKALEKTGFKIDSSASPGTSGYLGQERHNDWRKAKSLSPWWLSRSDYQSTVEQDSEVLEIPHTTFSFLGKVLKVDPVFGHLFAKAFDHYYTNFERIKQKIFFVSLTHSSEATYHDGSPTRTLFALENVINVAQARNVEFITMEQASKLL